MSSEIYEKLCERLNRFESKVPPVASFFSLLEEIYTQTEAEIAVAFPDGPFTMDQLADALNREKPELSSLIETMADKGQVFSAKTKTGEPVYELAPWMPGVIEFSLIRRMDTPKMKTILELTEKMAEEAKALSQILMKDEEALKGMLSDPHIRTLSVGEALPDNREIFPYENLLAMIDTEDSFAAMRCCCRHMADHRDDPCKKDHVPEYSCLSFGRVADYVVDRNFGRRITKNECRDILKTCSDAGLVHNTNNFIEGMQFVCNCCGCCCGFIKQVKSIGNLNVINASNFMSVVDKDSCIGCGDCEERCPMEAIHMSDDIAVVDPGICIGCGNCITTCPVGSLSMDRVSDKKPEIGDKKIGMGF
jgi:NAD-dependent dihydropyrimidine dehydrogenase PreA subunit